MNIVINSRIDIFYKQLLELLSSFSPVKELRKGEMNVLAEIMRQNYQYRHLKENARRNIIFSQDVKSEMCLELGISRDTFNTNLSILRKKKVISRDNILIKALSIFPDKEFDFTVTFKVKDNE